MKRRLLDYLCCPRCQANLTLNPRKELDLEIESGSLSCDGCRRDYEISEGIPRFVPVELSETVKLNVNNFGYEWCWLSSISEKNEIEFRSYLGEILPEGFASQVVLDAGCGMGKFLYFTGKYGAKDAIGVDLASGSVECAYKNTKHLENVHVVQADLFHLPLKPCFDFIYSIGVLHHLAHPEAGFHNLVGYLKTNGKIFAWVYGHEGNETYIRFLDPIRKITCRFPLWLNKGLAAVIASILWVVIAVIYRPLERLELRGLPFHEYFLYFSKLGFRFFWGTVFDKVIPSIAHYYRREEFLSWFSEAKLSEVSIFQRNANSWSGWGVKQ